MAHPQRKHPNTRYYQWLIRESKTPKVAPVRRVDSGDCKRFVMSPIGDNVVECHRSSLSWPMTNSLLPAFGPPQSQKTGVGSGSQLCPATRIIRSHKESTSRCSIQPKPLVLLSNYFAPPALLFFASHLRWTSPENYRAKKRPFKRSQTNQPKNCDHAHKTSMH